MGNGWIKAANIVYQRIEILVNKVIRTNFAADFVVIPPCGDEFLTVGMSIPYTLGNLTGGAADAK